MEKFYHGRTQKTIAAVIGDSLFNGKISFIQVNTNLFVSGSKSAGFYPDITSG